MTDWYWQQACNIKAAVLSSLFVFADLLWLAGFPLCTSEWADTEPHRSKGRLYGIKNNEIRSFMAFLIRGGSFKPRARQKAGRCDLFFNWFECFNERLGGVLVRSPFHVLSVSARILPPVSFPSQKTYSLGWLEDLIVPRLVCKENECVCVCVWLVMGSQNVFVPLTWQPLG